MHLVQMKYFTISRASVTSFNINLQVSKWYAFQCHTVSSKFIYLLFIGVLLFNYCLIQITYDYTYVLSYVVCVCRLVTLSALVPKAM